MTKKPEDLQNAPQDGIDRITRMSRPLDAALEARLVALIEIGVHVEVACKNCSLSYETFKSWYNRGIRGNPQYKPFSDAIQVAMSKPEVDAIRAVNSAANSDATDAMRFLERRYPNRWAKRTVNVDVDHDQLEDESMQLDLSNLTNAELDQLERLTKKAQGNLHDDDDDIIEER